MRNSFDRQLELLKEEMIKMGGLCEEAIELAYKGIKGEEEHRRRVFVIDNEIDEKERDIESICLKLLLQQQPVARDLRVISAALKMITDMERIGDQAADIAEISAYINRDHEEEMKLIKEMAKATIKMVTHSIDAYVSQDLELAKSVLTEDDTVDEYFAKVKASLIDFIGKNPNESSTALDLLMIGKYFERIGDHAQNIAEWVLFSISGIHLGEEDVR